MPALTCRLDGEIAARAASSRNKRSLSIKLRTVWYQNVVPNDWKTGRNVAKICGSES